MRFLVFTCALCCFSTAAAWADGNTGSIYGRVLISGSALPVCPITVRVESDREPPLKTHTSGDGSFYFLSVSPGRVKVTVGRSRAVRYVTVSANLQNSDPYVDPILLPPLRSASRITSQQAQLVRKVCRGRGTFYNAYVRSDYDATP